MVMKSLGEAFPEEQARCRELLKSYQDIGPAGRFGSMMIERTLRDADQAAISGDLVEMIRAYEAMKGCE